MRAAEGRRPTSIGLQLLLLLAAAAAPADGLRHAQAREFRAAMRAFIYGLDGSVTDGSDMADIVGGLVRLAFHDAATWDDTSPCVSRGGPDGCFMAEDGGNAGLVEVATFLQPICDRFARGQHPAALSRSDCWQLAAVVSLEEALPRGVTLDFDFQWGRESRDVCQGEIGRLPSAEGGYEHVLDIFHRRLGLELDEVIAINGAHTLGRAFNSVGGYPGTAQGGSPWVTEPAVFDNALYREMRQTQWIPQTSTDGNRNSFRDNRTTRMMLITDLSFKWDLGVGGQETGDKDPKSCTAFLRGIVPHPKAPAGVAGRECPVRQTRSAQIVDLFAVNRTAFYDSFLRGWHKLTEVGQTHLRSICSDVAADCPEPVAPPCVEPPTAGGGPTAPGETGSCDPSPLGGDYDCFIEVSGLPMKLHWSSPRGTTVHFAVTGENGWVGAAFAQRPGRMAPAQSVIGWGGGTPHVEPYELVEESGTRLAQPSAESGTQIGLSDTSVEEVSGETMIKFTVVQCTDGKATGEGCVNTEGEIDFNVAYHPTAKAIVQHPLGASSARALKLNLVSGITVTVDTSTKRADMRSVHGILMITSWIYLAPLGIFIRRYGKPLFGLSMSGSLQISWRAQLLHIIPMLCTFGLTLAGLGIALRYWWTPGKVGITKYGHSAIGHVIGVGICLQPIIGFAGLLYCPTLDHPMRRTFHFVHGITGAILLILSSVEVILGVANYKLLHTDWQALERAIIFGCAFWAGLFLLAEFFRSIMPLQRTEAPEQPNRVTRHIQSSVTDWEEVRRHNRKSDCWIVIEGRAFDVTRWWPDHPGGGEMLLAHAGGDATEDFLDARHSEAARRRMNTMFRGFVESSRVMNSVKLTEQVSSALICMELESANDILQEHLDKDVPEALVLTLLRIVSNMRVFRYYLPASVSTLDGGESNWLNSTVVPPLGNVTMLFCDLSGAIALWDISPVGMELCKDLFDRVIREQIASHAGYEVKTHGDAYKIAFSEAASACQFSLHLIETMEKQSWPKDRLLGSKAAYQPITFKDKTVVPQGLRCRIGIDRGRAEHERNPITNRVDYKGRMVVTAARVCRAATPAMAMVTDAVRDAAEEDLHFERIKLKSAGERDIKDIGTLKTYFLSCDFTRGREQWYFHRLASLAAGDCNSLASGTSHRATPQMPMYSDGNVVPQASNPLSARPNKEQADEDSDDEAARPRSAKQQVGELHTLLNHLPSKDSPRGDKSSQRSNSGVSLTSSGGGLEWVPHAPKLAHLTTQAQLVNTVGTIAVVNLVPSTALPNLQASDAQARCSGAVLLAAECAGRTSGKIISMLCSSLCIGWNVVSPCASHLAQAVHFTYVMLDQTGFTLGAATSRTVHGHTGAGRYRYYTVTGSAPELARRAAAQSESLGARALFVFEKTPLPLQPAMRPVDVWEWGGQQVMVEDLIFGPRALQMVGKASWDVEPDDGDRMGNLHSGGGVQTPESEGARKAVELAQEYRQAYHAASKGDSDALSRLAELCEDDHVLQGAHKLLQQRIALSKSRRTSGNGGGKHLHTPQSKALDAPGFSAPLTPGDEAVTKKDDVGEPAAAAGSASG
eukprot:TRINITY_DN13211_c0_g1_i1.p1 TRINITY_DN13211_c0_g1~~TRINITY_DN13211_c0_g1_i1.p1  ORF type:complete len:1620 (+),score=357.44 TRINITY_DN13211_c0_g1_i1:129-4862(+)